MDPARDPKTFSSRFELDYFRRARKLRRWKWLLTVIALLVSVVVVATLIAAPRFHTVFQAAPVSHSHAIFGDNCALCHDQPFGTLARFVPGATGGTVSDAKCLACHDTGRHDAHQIRHGRDDGQAAGCIDCHKEHRGETLSQLPDGACVDCHANVQTTDGVHRYHSQIRHFADGHPEFGAWRKGLSTDPAGQKFFFNHERHLNLTTNLQDVSKESRPKLIPEIESLRQKSCGYCHQHDSDMKRMQPIRYDAHCAACHPLNVQAMPSHHWSADIASKFASQPVPHPGPGENAAVVRANILQRYLALSGNDRPVTTTVPVQPPILRNDEQAKEIRERERVALERTRLTEAALFDGADGCQRCHKKIGQKDDLPEFAFPHQQLGRWKDEMKSWPADWLRHAMYADDANRWHPLATFDHSKHRTYACTECHPATNSQKTEDVLIPTIASCLKCHNQRADSAHSNCLTCHSYHDRSQERPARLTTPDALQKLLKRAKP